MRRTPSILLLSVFTPALLALPVMTSPAPKARPVPPVIASLELPSEQSLSSQAPVGRATEQPAGRRTVVLTGQRNTARFDLAGVTWDADSTLGQLEVLARTRTDGRWSDWTSLGGLADDEPEVGGPDGTPTRAGTSPMWAGKSDGVQVRVDVLSGAAPRNLRLSLIDAGSSDADAGLGGLPASTATAAATRPVIRSRGEWGADETLRSASPAYAPTLRAATIHQTASSNDYTPEQVPSIIRGFYAYHVKSLGWSDIGYNVLVDKFGTAWEGRAGGLDRPVVGAHSGGFNTETVGISMIGTYSSVPPSAATRATVAGVVGWKLGLHQRDPRSTVSLTSGGSTRFAAGTVVTLPAVFGHRDVSQTDCPGAQGMAALPGIRDAAAAAIGAGFVDPVRRDSVAGVTVTAGVTRPMSWRLSVSEVASGAVVRSYSGSGAVNVTWDRRGTVTETLTGGAYRLTLSGADGGSTASEWSTTTDVVGAPPVRSQPGGPLAASSSDAGRTDVVSRTNEGAATWRQIQGEDLMGELGLGGIVLGSPAVASRGGLALDLFARGTDSAVWSRQRATNGEWGGWTGLGGPVSSRPSAAAGAGGRLDLTAQAPNGTLLHRWSDGPGHWAPWESLGGSMLPGTAPASSWTSTGRYDVLVVGTDRQIWQKSWSPQRGWQGWLSLGGATGDDPSAAADGDEVVTVVRGTDGGAWSRGATSAAFGAWTKLGGGLTGGPAVASAPGARRVEVVVAGTDGGVYRTVRQNGSWNGWRRLT